MPTSPDSSPIPQKTLFFVFFISGFCSLLYQLVWIRLAFAAFGVNTPVLSTVLSIFMAGLAIGSWWGGRLTARSLNGFNPILLYSVCEVLIGLGALLIPLSFSLGVSLLLPIGEADSVSYLFLSAVVLFFSILPWCICMGATFPLMMDFIKKNNGSEDGFSFLYTANVLGAMFGTGLTAFVLIECLGLRGTLEIASCLNLLIALIALKISQRFPFAKTEIFEKKTSIFNSNNQVVFKNKKIHFLILFTTGFVFMAMEVVWTRGFTYVLQTEVYSYASLLFTYLCSTFLGSWLYRNTKNPSLGILIAFLFLFALLPVVIDDPRIHHSSIIILLSIMPVCTTLGYLTPLLIDSVSQGNPQIAASAYALNVLGCILGPLAASYLFLPFLGARNSIITLSLFLTIFLINKNFRPTSLLAKSFLSITAAGLLMTAVFWSADYEDCFLRFNSFAHLRRDYCATVISYGINRSKWLIVNGINMTGLVMPTKVMAHLPLILLTRQPQSALDICFGMGTTFRSLLSWNIDVTAVDLVPSVLKSFGEYWPDASQLESLPRAHMVIDDGRRFLKRTTRTFDIITVDPPPPLQAAASSLLYSTGFYDLVKQHLKKGGLLQQWLPSGGYGTWNAVARSINISFPYVLVFPATEKDGVYFIASLEPIHIPTSKELMKKIPISALQDLSEWMPASRVGPYLEKLLTQHIPIEVFTYPPGPEMITDDRPFNEYYFLRKWKWILFHSTW